MNNHAQPSRLSIFISILMLPFNVTITIPIILLYFFSGYRWEFYFLFTLVLILFGIFFIATGLTLVIIAIKHFSSRGKGTLAPWDPPKRLVVSGPYQYSRNPMISGVSCILLGEALIFSSLALLSWFILFITVNYLYFILREEPLLTKKFGSEYVEYKKRVPRLVPRRDFRKFKNGK